jgi:outer membrane biosynthesis protein TonB
MLSLSIHKNLDYSTPIFFVPAYVKTTADRPLSTPAKTTPQKVTVNKPKPVTLAAPTKTDVKKPTTIATAPKKIEPTKLEPPKQEVVKNIEPAKQEIVKKVEPEKQEVAQKVDVKKNEQIKQEIVEPTPIAQALDIQQPIIPIIPDNAQISHNYREVEALRKQAQLQKEIVQTWKPPIGVSPDCMCEVSFFVTSKGKIENIKIIKSSGVMMFDISVRQALFAMKMPQWTYGKPFTIDFKQ